MFIKISFFLVMSATFYYGKSLADDFTDTLDKERQKATWMSLFAPKIWTLSVLVNVFKLEPLTFDENGRAYTNLVQKTGYTAHEIPHLVTCKNSGILFPYYRVREHQNKQYEMILIPFKHQFSREEMASLIVLAMEDKNQYREHRRIETAAIDDINAQERAKKRSKLVEDNLDNALRKAKK